MSTLNTRATAGCLIVSNDKLLMVLESQDGRQSWDIPAGGIDAGESPLQAVIREVQEETGVSLPQDPELLRIFWQVDAVRQTVHFLYQITLPTDFSNDLSGANVDADITAVCFQSKDFVTRLIAEGNYEHELARKRLELFIDNGYLKDQYESHFVTL